VSKAYGNPHVSYSEKEEPKVFNIQSASKTYQIRGNSLKSKEKLHRLLSSKYLWEEEEDYSKDVSCEEE
jgi:hypothetical protein